MQLSMRTTATTTATTSATAPTMKDNNATSVLKAHRSAPVPWMHGAAGIAAGAFSMTLFYPLDLIRTRLHAETLAKATGNVPPTVRSIVAQEGVKGLYRGVKVAVAAHSVGWGLYLTIFRAFQQRASQWWGTPSSAVDFSAACGAAACTATLVTPLNVLKTRAQLNRSGNRTCGSLQQQQQQEGQLRAIVRQEGFRALLRGVGPQMLLSSHTTIQVALYECVKRQLWGKDDAPMTGVACVSGLSKAIASTVCNPLEVCRTRLQDKRNAGNPAYASMSAAFRTIWKNEGAVGLYRGVGVNVMRVVPTTMVAFVVYEASLRGIMQTVGSKLPSERRRARQ